MYAELPVNLTSAGDYFPNGDDMKICFRAEETQEFGTTTALWVNDAINNVDWTPPNHAFDPPVSNITMYNAPNGFNVFFKEENETWCLDGGFGKML